MIPKKMNTVVYVFLLLDLLAGSSGALQNDISGAEYGSKFGIKELPWKNLEYLDIRSNKFEGAVPAPSPNLKVFLISSNKFTGQIPRSICNSSTIEILDLSNNSLSGTIPECIVNYSTTLRVLDLRKNKFHGLIPTTFSNGSNLRTINFNGNDLEGSVPKSLLNCTNLEVLDLGNNKIHDTFPHWLGSLRDLQVLVLRSNKFHGRLGDYDPAYPFSKLRIFDISNNNFSGSLPALYFENLKAMMDTREAAAGRELKYMGDSYYEDSVTLVVKRLEVTLVKILTIYTTIDFSINNFNGKIPELIGKLQSLRLLNLSQNSLSGNIPSSLGNLTNLESLDLSSNKLEDVIPKQLTSLTFLAALNLSQNKLVGPIPEGNQFGTFSNDSYGGNLGLCGFPLSKKCGNPPQPPSSMLQGDAESEVGFGWNVVLIGYGCGMVIGMVLGYVVLSTGKPQWIVRIVGRAYHGKVRRHKRIHRGRRN